MLARVFKHEGEKLVPALNFHPHQVGCINLLVVLFKIRCVEASHLKLSGPLRGPSVFSISAEASRRDCWFHSLSRGGEVR
eukprot:1229461-Rhodomonas_salina.3